MILREAARVVRVRLPLVIAETKHGFICASAGVDASNAPGAGNASSCSRTTPMRSAKQIRDRIRELTGREVAVLITDSFGRPWRQGTIDVALGASGLEVMRDLRGTRDGVGYELHSTMIAVADEIASAAELVMGKVDGIPAGNRSRSRGRGRRTRPRPRHSGGARPLPLTLGDRRYSSSTPGQPFS